MTQTKPEIQYDRNLKIAGIGMMPFYRLGPEKWFDDYHIVSFYEWDVGEASFVHAAKEINSALELDPQNTNSLVQTAEFEEILQQHNLQDHTFLTYKPLDIVPQFKTLDPTRHTDTFENKAWLREQFGNMLNFPQFEIHSLDEISRINYSDLVSALSSDGLVIQHEALSGGRGTFIVVSEDEFSQAITELRNRKGVGGGRDKIIISELLTNSLERSIQCCITRYGTLKGPMQQQIVRNALLVDTTIESSDQFCGGTINNDLVNQQQMQEIHQVADLISNEMKSRGYKGIFGIDFLIDQDENVYVLEVNARLTGMTPLLTQSQKKYPFLLLHILENLQQDYTFEDEFDLSNPEEIQPCSYLLFHGFNREDGICTHTPHSGTYKQNEAFERVSDDLWMDLRDDSYVLHNYLVVNQYVRAGARLATLFIQQPQPSDGSMLESTQEIAKQIRNMYELND